MAILASLIFFIPLITGAHKTSPLVKFYTNQGLLIWILSIGWSIVSSVILRPIFRYTALSLLINLLISLGSIAIFAILIFNAVNASSGKMKQLPIIGHLELIK